MSKRFILFLGMGIMMALTGIVLSSRDDLFGPGDIETPEALTPPARSGGPQRPVWRPGASRTTPESLVPRAPGRMTLDGRADDWAGAKVLFTRGAGRVGTGTFGCKTVRLARDRKHLYVLFELTRGVGEVFEASRTRRLGEPLSPTLGVLDFDTEGRAFSMRVSAGYSVTRHAGLDAKIQPIVRVDVVGFDPRALMLSAGSHDPAPPAAFEGKTVEIALPLETLGLIEARHVEATFEEM